VDLAGESGAFGEDPGFAFGGGKLSLGGEEFYDERFALLGFVGKGLLAESDQQGDAGADERTDDTADGPPAV